VYDNETQYKLVYERLNSGVHDLNPAELTRIQDVNAKKSAAGEEIVLKPAQVNLMIDQTGLNLKRKGSYSFTGRHAVID